MATIATIATTSVLLVSVAQAQTKPAPAPAQTKPAPAVPAQGSAAKSSVAAPADYVIGPSDVLSINYRNEKDMTGDYIVRPDGMITLPLLSDISAVGLTPEQLTEQLVKSSDKWFINPTITVVVKAINSRKVSITGYVEKPGQYDILAPLDVVQLISLAGGLREFTDGNDITIIRKEGGKATSFKFNYKDVLTGKKLEQNIQLKPGDSVLVPE